MPAIVHSHGLGINPTNTATIRVRSYRLWVFVWATLMFGTLGALTIWQQLSSLSRAG